MILLQKVVHYLNRVISSTLELDPKHLLLNIFVDPDLERYTKLLLSYATYYARS